MSGKFVLLFDPPFITVFILKILISILIIIFVRGNCQLIGNSEKINLNKKSSNDSFCLSLLSLPDKFAPTKQFAPFHGEKSFAKEPIFSHKN